MARRITMDKTKEIFDKLAAENAQLHATARKALANYNNLRMQPPEELEAYFIALCRVTDEKYDRSLKVRRRIVRLLPDVKLVNLLGLRMPCQLARMISIRLCPRDDKSWGPHMVYFNDLTED
jgi:hypothetical protein